MQNHFSHCSSLPVFSAPLFAQEAHEKWLQYLEGTWQFTLSNGETGTLKCYRPEGNNGLTFVRCDGVVFYDGIIGWDPVAKSSARSLF